MQSITLERGKGEKIANGHLWVFRDDIASISTIEIADNGELVHVCDHRSNYLGTGFVDKESKILVRIFTKNKSLQKLDKEFFFNLLTKSWIKRTSKYYEPFYRLFNAEGDGFPSLIVDRYGDYLSVKINSAGLAKYKQEILGALQKLLSPKGMKVSVIKASEYVGEVPDEIEIIENGLKFSISLKDGQKTGWYFDQRENRMQMREYVKGKKVLDAFCYEGGFGINAASEGASEVVFVDTSERAIAFAQANYKRNMLDANSDFICDDVFKVLEEFIQQAKKFDVIILDPPPFIKQKNDFNQGIKKYQKLIELAAPLLNDGAILLFAACSHYMPIKELKKCVYRELPKVARSFQITKISSHPYDHPINSAIKETKYLNAVFGVVNK